MKKIISKLMGGVLLFSFSMSLTSCEDILGEWSRPTPNPVTPSGGTATVTNISIDPTLALKVGETGQLTATVDPAGTAVTWSSDQEAIATVDANGLVTAIAEGTATITAKAGDKSATCTVTVTEVYTAKDYKEGSWDGTNNKVVFTKQTAASEPTAVANSDANVTWDAGWYTVSGNVTITGDVKLTADAHLILQDGATLTINGKIDCNTNGKNLYIYGQKKGDGKLIVTNSNDYGLRGSASTFIEIHGGEITATTQYNALYAKGIKVYGGKITATATGNSSGITFGTAGFDVYGGEIEATNTSTSMAFHGFSNGFSFPLTVYGGKVTATGNANGSGFHCYVKSGTSGIKFYFSDNGTDWGDGTSYASATQVGYAAATKKRYAKAE